MLTAALASSCGNGASSAHQAAAVVSPPGSVPSSVSTEAPIPAADIRPCANVQAILSHIAADTARWSPTKHPFNDTIATRLGTETSYMNQQAMTADYRLRKAVADTSTAFGMVSRSIAAHSQKQLNKAIKQSQVAYAVLKKICHYSSN